MKVNFKRKKKRKQMQTSEKLIKMIQKDCKEKFGIEISRKKHVREHLVILPPKLFALYINYTWMS